MLANCRALASSLLDSLLDALESPGEQGAATAALPYFLVWQRSILFVLCTFIFPPWCTPCPFPMSSLVLHA